MKPILEINDFTIWMIYDETEVQNWAFSLLEWVDVRWDPWTCQNALALDNTISWVQTSVSYMTKIRNAFPWDTQTDWVWNILFYKKRPETQSWVNKQVAQWFSFYNSSRSNL